MGMVEPVDPGTFLLPLTLLLAVTLLFAVTVSAISLFDRDLVGG